MKTFCLVIWVGVLMLFSCPVLNADTLSVGLGNEFAVLRGSLPGNPQASRAVVAIPLSGLPAQSKIDYAEVNIPYFLPSGFTGTLRVDARPITRTWDKNTATWTVPWQRAGGDFDTTKITSFTLGKVGRASVRLDVTGIVRDWVNQRASNFGLLLKRPKAEGDAFRAEIADLQRVLSQVRLKVYYHRAGSKGFGSSAGREVSK